MNEVIFLLFMVICIGLIYVVHKYFGKHEFYILAIIYTIISFLMSFKLISVFGMNINAGIIFNAGLIMILYYFINRYDIKEYKKFNLTILISNLICGVYLLSNSFMIPSIYDKVSVLYQNLILDNLVILIVYPISLVITLFLSGYCFNYLKEEDKNKRFKKIITIIGLMFIDTFIFIYFSYAVLIRFDKALVIAVENYFIKCVIMIIYMFILDKIFSIRKVK